MLQHQTGTHYSAPTDNSKTDYISEEESLPDKTPCDHRKTDPKYPDIPQDRNRTSTLIPQNHIPREVLEEIIHHLPALQVPPVDIVVAPGQHNQAVNLGIQRVQGVQGMAGRWGQQQQLQGADPALVQILQLMNNRDQNRDNARKKFLMFPKEAFTKVVSGPLR